MMTNGGLPYRVTILFEGEQECGSSSRPKFLRDNAKELKADIPLVCDTNVGCKNTRHHGQSARSRVRGSYCESRNEGKKVPAWLN